MALLRAKVGDIPTDAVVLSEIEAIQYQRKNLERYAKTSDILGYTYGPSILGLASGLAGAYINNLYRSKFKLLSYGKISSFLPIFVIPSVLSYILHEEFVLPSVILQKECVVCTELRSSSMQAVSGSVVPSLMAPTSAFALAMRYGTISVPYITQEPMKVLKMWIEKTRPIGNILFGIFIGQAFLASVVTYFEGRSIENYNMAMLKVEEERLRMQEIQ